MKTINIKFNRGIYPVLTFFVLSIVLFMLSRTALLIWHPEGTEGHIFDIYKYGLLYDVSINCTMYAVVFLICILSNFLSKVPAFILILQKTILYANYIQIHLQRLSWPTAPFLPEPLKI